MTKPKDAAKLKRELKKEAIRRAPQVQVTPQKLSKILKKADGKRH